MGGKESINQRVSRLTPGQIDCLRGVLHMKSSKEIAKDLGISSHTVDRRLKDAMRILEARTRLEAARMLVESGQEDYQRLAYQLPAVGEPDYQQHSLHPGAALATHLAEERATFEPSLLAEPRSDRFFGWERRHDLTIGQKLLVILGVMLASPLFLGALLSALMIADIVLRPDP
jgi:DNA-binding CsgD family transcriptional regulator